MLKAVADTLTREPMPQNVDDKALRDREPWHRLRVDELRIAWYEVRGTRYVGRIVKRGDLERAVKTLPEP